MNKDRKHSKKPEDKDGLEQKLVDLARVTRVTRGGKRLSFQACVAVGDGRSTVGYGVSKGTDVAMAVSKAVTQAKKIMIKPYIIDGTLPYECKEKFKSALVMIRPGKHGSGIIAGGVVRTMLELASYNDAVAKMIGSKNKINNVKAVYNAFKKLN